MISGKQLVCMIRRDRRELLPFNPKPEWTLHRLHREVHVTQLKIMQNQEDEGQILERNEPQVDQNRQNYRAFVQHDNLHMLLEEFTLPPIVVQSAIRRPPIQANNFELK